MAPRPERWPLRSPYQSVVLDMGHIDAKGGAVGWTFRLDHLTPEQLAIAVSAPDPMEKARYAGWSMKALREFWLHVRKN